MQRSTFDALDAAQLWSPNVTYDAVLDVIRKTPKKLSAVVWVALFFSNVALFGLLAAIGDLALKDERQQAWYALVVISGWLVIWFTATGHLATQRHIDKASAQWLYAVVAAGTSAWGLAVAAVLESLGYIPDAYVTRLEYASLPPTVSCIVMLWHGRTTASGTLLTGLLFFWLHYFMVRWELRWEEWSYYVLVLASLIYCVGAFADIYDNRRPVPWEQFLGPPSALFLGFHAIIFELLKLSGSDWPGKLVDWVFLLLLAYAPITMKAVTTNNQFAWITSYAITWIAVAIWTVSLEGSLGPVLGWLINLSMGLLGIALAFWVRGRRPQFDRSELTLLS